MAGKAKSTKVSKNQAATDINFKFKSIRTSCSGSIDFAGNKRYRTVFRLNEVERLYVDTEIINKQFDICWNRTICIVIISNYWISVWINAWRRLPMYNDLIHFGLLPGKG